MYTSPISSSFFSPLFRFCFFASQGYTWSLIPGQENANGEAVHIPIQIHAESGWDKTPLSPNRNSFHEKATMRFCTLRLFFFCFFFLSHTHISGARHGVTGDLHGHSQEGMQPAVPVSHHPFDVWPKVCYFTLKIAIWTILLCCRTIFLLARKKRPPISHRVVVNIS